MENAKKTQRIIEGSIAVVFGLLLAVIAVIKITNKDIYGSSNTTFELGRTIAYAVGILCALVGLITFIISSFTSKVNSKTAMTYGLFAVSSLCFVFVQAFSLAGEFENQGKTLQDVMYVIVYIVLAGILFLMCAMENPKPIFRVIIISIGSLLLALATTTDLCYLLEKTGRITSESEGIISFALHCDKILALVLGISAVIKEVIDCVNSSKNNITIKIEEVKEAK